MKPVFDNSSLIDFLASKDPNATYDYIDGRHCALTQYLHYRGFNGAVVDNKYAYLPHAFGPTVLPPAWNHIVRESPWSFGDALKRAREAFAKPSAKHSLVGRRALFVVTDEAAQ